MIGRGDSPYRVWHIPQVPGKPFHVPCEDLDEAVAVVALLGRYDAFQLEERIKPDYSNVSGIEVFVDGEWSEVDEDDLQQAKDDAPEWVAEFAR